MRKGRLHLTASAAALIHPASSAKEGHAQQCALEASFDGGKTDLDCPMVSIST